jgi:hypothetical protein
MKHIIPYIALTGALLSFAFGQTQQESTDSKSEQEVKQMIEKYRAAFLRHDIPTLEKIWADDYVFVNAFGAALLECIPDKAFFEIAVPAQTKFKDADAIANAIGCAPSPEILIQNFLIPWLEQDLR